ncbi:hypothetical protein [Streptomyces sp. NPDC059781]|uniref:hypothetical protein n=1 Tax=Streptomyces sp. NPDC059781 TaxID=3346943 RepID=UPI00365769BD
MSDTPRDPSPGTYNASPTDQARTYQTGGAQHITEYHYHGTPPPPARPARTRSLAMRVLLPAGLAVVLGGGGTALWAFGPWQSAGDARSSPSPKVSSSPSPQSSATTKPTDRADDSTTPPTAESKPAPAPTASDAAEPAEARSSSPSPEETHAYDCRGRTTTNGMTLDICVRRASSAVYMSYRLTGTETPRLVDVYMWLEETATERVVDYVAAKDEPYSWPQEQVDSTTLKGEQLVETQLREGTSYEICVGVLPAGDPVPKFRSTDVSGFQHNFVY